MTAKLYKPGDTVVVTPDVLECEYGCNGEMERLIGYKVTIAYSDGTTYGIEEGGWAWTDRCFAPATPSITEEAAQAIFSELMGG